ncbi:MAG: DUF3145 domain-containing protein [Actinomycetes bacterium]
MTTCGVLFVHSAPAALCPHVEWAISGVMGSRASFAWQPQSASPGHLRTELCWEGPAGSASRMASALRGWQALRFEVTEDPGPGREGERYAYTPTLGVFCAVTGIHGDILVPEDRLKAALAAAARGESQLEDEVRRLVGRPWDDELEPFRHAGDGAPVRWLHEVG